MDNVWYVMQGEHVIYIGDKDTAIKVANTVAGLLGDEYINSSLSRPERGDFAGKNETYISGEYYISTIVYDVQPRDIARTISWIKYEPFSAELNEQLPVIEKQLREVLNSND